jgi:cbb3-type cytochrome oxidase subunit 3
MTWFSITLLVAFALALLAVLAIKYQEHRKKS